MKKLSKSLYGILKEISSTDDYFASLLNDPKRIEYTLRGYLAAVDFTDSENWEDENEDFDSSEAEFSPEAIAQAKADITKFLNAVEAKGLLSDLFEGYAEGGTPDDEIWDYIGHDIWMTRTDAGVGFWDRNFLDSDGLGDTVTKICESVLKETSSYVGDDGLIYFE